MNPPYEITSEILELIASISEKIGQINAKYLDKPSPKLRKKNRIKTIHSSLSIEGNTLSEDQITSLIENKHIIGPKKDVNEVLNAIQVYSQLQTFNPDSTKSFLNAHADLMKGLIADNGKYRKKGVGITAGDKFNRKDYMNVFKDISSATASRDLKRGVELGIFEKEGDKTKTIYRLNK